MVHQSEVLQNNTVVVQGPTGVLVVDAGITAAEMRCLATDLREVGPVVAGFSTHPDWDHVLWHDELGDAPRYGTARCAAAMKGLRAEPGWQDRVVEHLPPEIVGEVPLRPFGLVAALPPGAEEIPWDGPRVRVVEHPAHSPGHAALVVGERRVLIAGDMLSDLFVPMLDDHRGSADPVADYLTGLQALESVAGEVDAVVPGHGSVGTGDEVRARIALDRAYVRALREGGGGDDPRVASPRPGWEWAAEIHTGQVEAVRRRPVSG